MNIACGITTAPRDAETLMCTLTIASAAGFTPHIFEDPRMSSRAYFSRRLGPLGNFCCSLHELLVSEPNADVYLMLQDDVLLARGLMEWFSRQWPQLETDCASLYTGSMMQGNRGWNYASTFDGALAVAFSRPRAIDFLAWSLKFSYSSHGVDRAICEWLGWAFEKSAYHIPSLAQHIGDTSSIMDGRTRANKGSRRAKDDWIRDVAELENEPAAAQTIQAHPAG